MSPSKVLLGLLGLIHLASHVEGLTEGDLNGKIGKGYRFIWNPSYMVGNGDVVTHNSYSGGDPGCCKLCKEHKYTKGKTTEFFDFSWDEDNNNGICKCMQGDSKEIETDPYGPIIGYCGNDPSFLDRVDGALGEDRAFTIDTMRNRMEELGFIGRGVYTSDGCCPKCQELYPTSAPQMFHWYRWTTSCMCYAPKEGERLVTSGKGGYAGLCAQG